MEAFMTLQISQTKRKKKYNLWNNSSAEHRILGCLWEQIGIPLCREFIRHSYLILLLPFLL